MIPAYYDGLSDTMKELVKSLGVNLIPIPTEAFYLRDTALGEHLRGSIWVRMENHDCWSPATVLLHEIGHWTGGKKHLARPSIVQDDLGLRCSMETRDHEEAIAQYTMMLLAPVLGVCTEVEARALFYKYVTWTWDVPSVTTEAYRAFAYVRMLAPHLFGQKPVEIIPGPTNGLSEEAA